MISNVSKIIDGKELAEIQVGSTVREACKVMCKLDVDAVVVMNGEALAGVLSERDVIRKCVCVDRHTSETEVTEIMTPDPQTISADGNLAQALEIMFGGGFHHVPVVKDGKTLGLISSDDIPEEHRMLLERFKEMRFG